MSTAVFGAPDFKARSGRTVRSNEDGSISFQGGNGYIGPGLSFDAEEFFQAKRDAELGRWRWPENPDFVAWASRRSNEKDVTVLDESDGYVGYFTRADVEDERSGEGLIRRAARAYFEAHPERRPWEDAKSGEAWVFTIDGIETAVVVDTDGDFTTENETLLRTFPEEMGRVAAARRVWPEDAS